MNLISTWEYKVMVGLYDAMLRTKKTRENVGKNFSILDMTN